MYLQPTDTSNSAVAIIHGHNASMEWGFFPEILHRISDAGYLAIPVTLGLPTPSQEVDHVHDLLSRYPSHTIHFLGHSRGGAIAQIVAAERNLNTEKVVVWAGIGTWMRGRTQMQQGYYADAVEHDARLNIAAAAFKLRGRVMYLHAQADLTVPIREARTLTHASHNDQALHEFYGSTHTFGITHPMTESTTTFETAMAMTTDFFAL